MESSRVFAVVGDALQQFCHLLGTASRQLVQTTFAAGGFQFIDARNLGCLPEQRNRLRSHAGQAQQFQHRRLVAGQQFLVQT